MSPSETSVYYVWDSERRVVGVERAGTMELAASNFALRNKTPFNVALRAVLVEDVLSIGFRLDIRATASESIREDGADGWTEETGE